MQKQMKKREKYNPAFVDRINARRMAKKRERQINEDITLMRFLASVPHVRTMTFTQRVCAFCARLLSGL